MQVGWSSGIMSFGHGGNWQDGEGEDPILEKCAIKKFKVSKVGSKCYFLTLNKKMLEARKGPTTRPTTTTEKAIYCY